MAEVAKTLKEAMTTPFKGLKVIIAEGECQLERQRRIRPLIAAALKGGERVVRTATASTRTPARATTPASGSRAARRSPSRTTRTRCARPGRHVIDGCVGCGLCGENAHAAVLCPSFFRAEVMQNPTWWDRALARVRAAVIGWLQPA